MKSNKCLAGLAIMLLVSAGVFAQKTKFLSKSDASYNSGTYEKAKKYLDKYKASLAKLGTTNKYLPGYYTREARLSLALGLLTGFEGSINNALSISAAAFGETTAGHADITLDVAAIYIDYGNFRLAREYVDQAKKIIESNVDITESLKSKIAMIEAEAMIEQGFANDALKILKKQEVYLAGRAVEKETYVENGSIKNRRVPEGELASRFGDYAKCMMLIGSAYSKKGNTTSADSAFTAVRGWIRDKNKYLGETNTVGVENNFRWASYLVEGGNSGNRES
jgi:tetratricopeptide (TPR) repeat protein